MTTAESGTVIVPKTITPLRVAFIDTAIFVAVLIFFMYLLGSYWGAFLGMLTISGMIASGGFTTQASDFEGGFLFNSIGKSRRAVFGGFHPKLPPQEQNTIRRLI